MDLVNGSHGYKQQIQFFATHVMAINGYSRNSNKEIKAPWSS